MLKPGNMKKYPRMTKPERAQLEQALAEEQAGREENVAAARDVLPRLMSDAAQAVRIVRGLREAREAAGVSLAEMEARTGIRKSAWSRLENSKAPNPTLASLQRYARALGKELVVGIQDACRSTG